MKQVGAITIGQAPRPDICGEIQALLGDNYCLVEAGALDGLTQQQVHALQPAAGEDVQVTRLADGSIVQVAERHLTPLLQGRVSELFARGLPLVLLLCTGEFPPFEARGLLLQPQALLRQVSAALAGGRKVGVLCPTAAHLPQVSRQWAAVLTAEPVVRWASPYEGVRGVEQAARELKSAGVELAVLDCIAYTLAMQSEVRERVGVPVLLPRSLAACVVREVLG